MLGFPHWVSAVRCDLQPYFVSIFVEYMMTGLAANEPLLAAAWFCKFSRQHRPAGRRVQCDGAVEGNETAVARHPVRAPAAG